MMAGFRRCLHLIGPKLDPSLGAVSPQKSPARIHFFGATFKELCRAIAVEGMKSCMCLPYCSNFVKNSSHTQEASRDFYVHCGVKTSTSWIFGKTVRIQ